MLLLVRRLPLLLCALAACTELTPPPAGSSDAGSSADADPCPSGQGAPGCELAAASTCPPGQRAELGRSDCLAVGPGGCPAGSYSSESGWGCEPVVSLGDCPAGTRRSLGDPECLAAGWVACEEEGFARAADGWGCIALAPPAACAGTARAELGRTGCVPLGDCAAAFPPPSAAYFVSAAYTPGELDATHFRGISEALAAAPAGAVVAVESGSYAESLAPARSVELVGRCGEQVLIDGTGSAAPALSAGPGVEVQLRGMRFRGHPGGLQAMGGRVLAAEVGLEAVQGDALAAVGAGSELELARGWVRAARVAGRGVAGALADGGAVRLDQVEISAVAGTGLYARNGGILRAARVLVLGTQPVGAALGFGAHADSGRLELENALLADNRAYGVIVRGTGTASVSATLIRGTVGGSDGRGIGLAALGDGRLDAFHAEIDGAVAMSALVEGRARLRLMESLSIRTRIDPASGLAAGLLANNGGYLELVGSAAVLNNAVAAVARAGTLVARHSRLGASRGVDSLGVLIGFGGSGELFDVELSGSKGYELQVQDQGSHALLESSVAAGTLLGVLDGAALEVRGSLVLNARDLGVFAAAPGSKLTVRESMFHDGEVIDDPGGGQGIALSDGAEALIQGSDFARNQNAAIYLEPGTHAEVQASVFREQRGGPDGKNGTGMDLEGEALVSDSAFVGNRRPGVFMRAGHAVFERCLFTANQVAGVFAYGGSAVEVRRSALVAQLESQDDGLFGLGLLVGGDLSVSDSLVRDNAYAGIAVEASSSPDGADVLIQGSVVAQTRADPSGFGHGIIVGNEARLVVRDTVVRDNASVGLVFTQASGLVERTLVSKNAVGTHAQDGSVLMELPQAPASVGAREVIFLPSARFLDNGTRVGVGEIPIPALFAE